jgi:hypothetical protein
MRFTISRCMAATAVLGLNIGWVRAYLIAEKRGEYRDLFDYVFLIFFALQLGLWRYLNTRGKRRRFWLGFEVSGLAATLALRTLFSDPGLDNWYTGAVSDLSYFILPAGVDQILSGEHWDWFLAIIYFLPELVAAALGGLLAVLLFRRAAEVRSVAAPWRVIQCPTGLSIKPSSPEARSPAMQSPTA